jgi:hypothetical protein
MANRTKRRWLDIQLILASLAVTSTVALWNNFARPNRPAAVPTVPPPPEPTFTLTYTPAPTATAIPTATVGPYVDANGVVRLPKLHLLLGGKLPAVPVVQVARTASSDASSSSGGSSAGPKGGGSPSNPPPPATNSGSSKP